MTSERRRVAVPPIGGALSLTLFLGLGSASPGDARAQSTVEGQALLRVEGEVLSDVTGLPLAGALVLLPSLELAGMSDDFGYFAFERVPTGVHQIVAYLAGYTALIAEAPAEDGEVLELHMSPSPIPLPGIGVKVASNEEQTARLLGRSSDLISRADVADAGQRTSQLLDVMRSKAPPRLQIRQQGGRGGITFCIQSTRRSPSVQELRDSGIGCQPLLVALDGVVVYAPPLTSGLAAGSLPEDVAHMILRQNPGEIENIRVLSPSDAFFRYGDSGRLGAVEIKTRHPRRRDVHPPRTSR